VATLALFLGAAAGPVASAPRLVSQTPLADVPGTIVAWHDSVYFALGRDSTAAPVLYRRHVDSGATMVLPLGSQGRGLFLNVAPDGNTILVRETDSTGVHRLQSMTLPRVDWRNVIPVTDGDPHVTWYGDSRTFLYQDILDNERGTPSVFRYTLGQPLPSLYLFGAQRPLLAPTGDAIVCVGVDTLNPGATRDIESRQPVGIEDLKTGDFHWVAPLRTWVPTRGAWTADGSRVALVGYDIDSTATLERRVYVHSRITRTKKIVPLPGDVNRPDREHSADIALWSPDGEWIAVPMVPPRGVEPGFPGGVWLIDRAGVAATLIRPTEGTWRGAPFWIDANRFLVPGPEESPGGPRPHWIVEIAG
jgi:hypothetical protein